MKKTIFKTLIVAAILLAGNVNSQNKVRTVKSKKVSVKKNKHRTVTHANRVTSHERHNRNHNHRVIHKNRNRVVVSRPSMPRVVVKRPNYLRHGYFWIDGYWKWSNFYAKYLWVDGRWERERLGYYWIAGYWEETPIGFFWVEGYWGY